jgi:ribosome-associated translation inhibitor RaiA
MQIQHFEKGVKYNDGEFLLLAKKVGRLATYCRFLKDEGSYIRIESEKRDTKKNRDQVMVAVTVFLPKKVLRAESLKFSALDGVDRCIEKLEEQIKKYKEMHTGRGKKRAKHGRGGDLALAA